MTREEIIKNLLRNTSNISQSIVELKTIPWDCENPIADLNSSHVIGILNAFINGEISSQLVEDWANAVECRDDIQYNTESVVGEILNEIANPLLFEQITINSALNLISRLSTVEN